MELLPAVVASYRGAANEELAAAQRQYMRDQFPFLGIPTPERRRLSKAVLKAAGNARPSTDECAALALRFWELPEREFRYFAVDYLVANVKYCDTSLLPTLRTLITTDSWWDTVDPLASRVVGALVTADPSLADEMDAWARDENMWIVRSAILHQLHYKAATDERRLFEYCTLQAGHKDFFIRKAIGWALREYAYTAPEAVRAFLDRVELSPLSVREASKHL
ncbi:DNA alkylation repair protein [Actinospica sp. MGRD01-02]|uniref:DNA alkylation repair protein n=1 Tax=Actinospica acidithermotolerans TaxID=2828514 RepID=A0A941IF75_9ACTN|nr:DNA alkylation repair protein [Actinospica acidithermotolerans]MBR7824729.1 DNA alkylation repair protein [Actinospica acidithermotolerans]